MFYYYFVCKRKLWFFTNQIAMEQDSEDVLLGKLLDEHSFSRENKQILIDDTVKVDMIKNWKVLHEIKKSKSIEEASIWQVKYYIYFLKQRGIPIEKGILDYPLLKQRKEVDLSEEDVMHIESIIKEIEDILIMDKPPQIINKKICMSCAYFEYCYI